MSMISIKEAKQLLNISPDELRKADTERLRTLLGIFRYLVRHFEREINRRCSVSSAGGVGITEDK